MKRAVGYVRESTEEQGQNFAPEVQRKAIRKYAQEQEFELAGWYEDFISGRKADKRPDFQRLINDAAERQFDVVLVFHSSRFARNVSEARRYKDWLRTKVGIDVISVTQRFGEQDDPSAFLMESINEVLDEHYSRNLGFLISGGLHEKAAQGYLVGQLPFGYVRPAPGERREAIPEPQEAASIKAIYERYATGKESYTTIADWLNAHGHRGRRGRPFTKDAVREILCNATYAGYVSGKRAPIDKQARGKFEAIVSRDLFERVRVIRQRRNTLKHGTRPSKYVYLLSGSAVCARCGAKLYGSRGGNRRGRGGGRARYVCATRARQSNCDQPIVLADVLEKQLTDFLRDFSLTEDQIGAAVALLRERARQRSPKPGPSAASLDKRLERLRDLYELGDITRPEYIKRKGAVQRLVAESEPLQPLDTARCVQLLRHFDDLWENESDQQEKQQFVGLVFEQIAVDGREIVAVKPRPENATLFTDRVGVQSGSDGTRTRDLRRDRPAL